MKRIAVICEVMHPPFDEGIRIFAAELARSLSRTHQMLLVSEKDGELDGRQIHGALTDRYFLSRPLADLLDGVGHIARAGWLAIFAGGLVTAAILGGYCAWRRFCRRFVGLRETLEEIREDMLWLRNK